jgi:Protein of unknown function (DUF742)
MSESSQAWDEADPERLYVITRGRSASDTSIDLVTLIVAQATPTPSMQPEHAAILRMCQSPLSIAEISAYLHLPVSVVSVLVTDLLMDSRVEARALVPRAQLPEPSLIEAVMHGLQKL